MSHRLTYIAQHLKATGTNACGRLMRVDDGNRAIKMTGNAAIDQTGTLLNSTNLENITIYPNEYLTVTQAEYTKYYYAGGNRIASKIGTGGFEKMQRLCTYDANITYNANTLLNYVLYHITNPTNQAQDAVPVETCNGYNFNTQLLAEPLPTLYITQTNLNFSQNNLLQQFRQNLAGGTEAVYYFHSDHLGSASWITSGTGGAVQHLQYLPFGEHFVNEQSTGYNERFTFTGKERDAETGYYYHGARFNSSDIGWLSVDPLADKYPSLTPYNYCAWNPVKLVDPDGEDWYEKDNDYYWSDKVVSKQTTPEKCKYIGDDDALYKHFGLPDASRGMETKQVVQTLVGSNVESNNPYEPKYYAFGTAIAKAKSSISYSNQKDDKNGKLTGITINASLETAVGDFRAGGYASAFLNVSCGNYSRSVPLKEYEGYAFEPRDFFTRNYLSASITIPANKLSKKSFSEIQITGPWFNNKGPMTIPLTLSVFPCYLKHIYK